MSELQQVSPSIDYKTLSLFTLHMDEFQEHRTIHQTISFNDHKCLQPEEVAYGSIKDQSNNSNHLLNLNQIDVDETQDHSVFDQFQISHEMKNKQSNTDVRVATKKIKVPDDLGKLQPEYQSNQNSILDPHSSVTPEFSEEMNHTSSQLQKMSNRDQLMEIQRSFGLYPHALKLSASASIEAINESMPDFAYVSTLGEGGMGTVYEMLQTSLQRSVAVKVAKAEDRLLNELSQHCHEAQVTGYLSHSHIPSVHLLAHDAEGVPLIVMRKIEGVTWEELIASEDHPFWSSVHLVSDQFQFHLDVMYFLYLVI